MARSSRATVEQRLLIVQARIATGQSKTKILTDLAFQAEGYAKVNLESSGRIDTGFAVNSIQALPPGASAGAGASAVMTDKRGRLVTRRAAPAPATDEAASAVAAGADYALWLELKQPFLQPAGMQAKNDLAAIVEKAKL